MIKDFLVKKDVLILSRPVGTLTCNGDSFVPRDERRRDDRRARLALGAVDEDGAPCRSRNLVAVRLEILCDICLGELPDMMSAKCSDFLTPFPHVRIWI